MKSIFRKKDTQNSISTLSFLTILILLFILLIVSILSSITFGNADISIKEVYSVIAYKMFHIQSLSQYDSGAVHDVVWIIRLPRVFLAVGVGMCLSDPLFQALPFISQMIPMRPRR